MNKRRLIWLTCSMFVLVVMMILWQAGTYRVITDMHRVDIENRIDRSIRYALVPPALGQEDSLIRVREMEHRELGHRGHREHRLSSVEYARVDSLLREKLREESILSPCLTRIKDEQDSVRFVSEGWPDGGLNEKRLYRGEMRPPHGKRAHIQLECYFPEGANYGIDSIYIALPSVLLVGMLIIVFVFALTTILRQKSIDQMKNDFIDNMTHEFKTPIASITLASEMLLDPQVKHSAADTARISGIINKEIKRLSHMVECILQLSVYDKSHSNIQPNEVDLHQLIKNVEDQFILRIEELHGTLTVRLEAEQTMVVGDEVHLSNVLFNLLDNALKYRSEVPRIEIRTQNSENTFILEVSDNGIGMTREQQKHAFERFYRASTGNVHTVKGYGLGLSYVERIVKGHHGRISVSSEVGHGSTFRIELPIINK